MKKQYELPYNFSYDFIPKLSRKRELFSYIRCIYLPAWKEDAVSTRQDIETREEYPKTYEEYVLRLKCLQQLGLPLCVLMQRAATLDALEKYYNLGIRIFTISEDALAVAAKSRHPEISVTLSITSARSHFRSQALLQRQTSRAGISPCTTTSCCSTGSPVTSMR